MINYLKIKSEVKRPVKRIPDQLLFPFTVFMHNGGYTISPTKEGFSYKKGNDIGKINGIWGDEIESYEMNEHCINRFKIFTELYLKHGKYFINELTQQGYNRLPKNLREKQSLKVAA